MSLNLLRKKNKAANFQGLVITADGISATLNSFQTQDFFIFYYFVCVYVNIIV